MIKYNWITKEILEKDYIDLGSFKLISEKYNIPCTTIKNYFKLFNIKTIPKIKYHFNENLFSYFTEESFYLAGFIAADGCILKNKSKIPNAITICLSDKDKNHLSLLKKIINFDGPIKTSTSKLSKYNNNWKDSKQCKFTIYSKKLINDLIKFGIGPTKSLTYDMPNWLINHSLIHHFLRGYSDGDGSFYTTFDKNSNHKGKMSFSLRGTKNFLINFKKILEKNNIYTISSPKYNNGIYQLRYSGNKQVQKVAAFLYKKASVFMDRKFELIKGFL